MKLLKITAPIAVIVALAGLWLIGLYLWTNMTRGDWVKGNSTSASASYSRQLAVTSKFPQPWLAQYNLGTALLSEGDLEKGLSLLEMAYQGVPKAVRDEAGSIQPFAYECSVRMNISAGFELQGDEATTAGENQAAEKLYKTALEWVSPCEVSAAGGGGDSADQEQNEGEGEGSGSSSGTQGEQGNEAGDRLREKLGENQDQESEAEDQPGSQEQGNGNSESQSQPEPFEGETSEQQERREELQERNQQQAEREREKSEQQNRGSGNGW